ncbi:MAG TPA: PEP-CTERM sorting domain-containing protein [Tepidisphaeraceae bacterium]|nr:PEP-CTERM sorting domain-containing protein [Tepidisphaeraceae bacterium]
MRCIVVLSFAALMFFDVARGSALLQVDMDTSGFAGDQLQLSLFVTSTPANNFSQATLPDSVVLSNFVGNNISLDSSRHSINGSLASGITINSQFYDAQPLIDFSPGQLQLTVQMNGAANSTDQFGAALILPDGGVAHTDLPNSAFLAGDLGQMDVDFEDPSVPSGATVNLSVHSVQTPEPASTAVFVLSLGAFILRRSRRSRLKG